jgi:GntP family permease
MSPEAFRSLAAPTLAVATFHADAGKTILYALVIGLPAGLISGPVFAAVAAKLFGLRRAIGKTTEQSGPHISPAEEIIAVAAETAHRTPQTAARKHLLSGFLDNALPQSEGLGAGASVLLGHKF